MNQEQSPDYSSQVTTPHRKSHADKYRVAALLLLSGILFTNIANHNPIPLNPTQGEEPVMIKAMSMNAHDYVVFVGGGSLKEVIHSASCTNVVHQYETK